MEIVCTVANIFVPGLGTVVNALAQVSQLCMELKDNQDTCMRVEKRFTEIYNQLLLMERRGTLPRNEAVNRYAELLERFYVFLVKQRKKNVISRLALGKSLQASIQGFHEDMDHLLTMLNLAHVDAVASSQQGWEKATLQQQQQLEMVVGNTGMLLKELEHQKRLQASGQAQPGDNRKLFVRDLAPETSDEAFRNAFQKYGQLQDAVVARDRDTGKCKGFGFLTFAQKTSADKALQHPQKVIEGRTVTCTKYLANPGGHKGAAALPTAYAMPMQQVVFYAAVPPGYPSAAVPGNPVPMQLQFSVMPGPQQTGLNVPPLPPHVAPKPKHATHPHGKKK